MLSYTGYRQMTINDLPHELYKVHRLENSQWIYSLTERHKIRHKIADILGKLYGICTYNEETQSYTLNYLQTKGNISSLLGGGTRGTGYWYGQIK